MRFTVMNHVAHCFLSFGASETLIGNFVADYVKGGRWREYPQGVQVGILMHRQIDAFADGHEAVARSRDRIRSGAGRYAGPTVDILYDFLLCRHWEIYAGGLDFDDFAAHAYETLTRASLPTPLDALAPRMVAGRFLHGYRHREGLAWVLERFANRISGQIDPHATMTIFERDLPGFDADFHAFFPDMLRELGK